MKATNELRSLVFQAARMVTPTGAFLLVVAFLGATIGLKFGWVELVVPGVMALILVVLAALFLLSRNRYHVDLLIDKDRVVAGSSIEVRVRVTNRGGRPTLPTWLQVPLGDALADIAVPLLTPKAHFESAFTVPTNKRGAFDVGPPVLARTSPIGVFTSESRWSYPHRILAYPRTVALPPADWGLIRDLQGRPSGRIVADDLSFSLIVEYAPGDPLNQVHWKSTAKAGSLMVRRYEESLRSEVIVALDNRQGSYLDEDEFELAVSAAASIAARAVTESHDTMVLSGPQTSRQLGDGERWNLRTSSPTVLLEDFTYLRSVENGVAPADLLHGARGRPCSMAAVILVTGSRTGHREVSSAKLCLPPDVGMMVVRATASEPPKIGLIEDAVLVNVEILEDLGHLLLRGGRR